MVGGETPSQAFELLCPEKHLPRTPLLPMWNAYATNLDVEDVKTLEPIDGLEALSDKEQAQFKHARKNAATLAKDLAEETPTAKWIVSMHGHVPTGEPNEAPAGLTVSVAEDQAQTPPPENA